MVELAAVPGGAGRDVEAVLRDLGASDAVIAAALRDNRPASLAVDLALARGGILSPADVAGRLGVAPGEVVDVWRLLGVHVEGDDAPCLTEDDLELTRAVLAIRDFDGGNADELFRVLGSALARVAESAVALYIQAVEPALGPGEGEWVSSVVSTVRRALDVGDRLGALFSHHLRDAVDLQRSAQATVHERSVFRLGVGFVDLVGSTPLVRRLDPAALVETVGRLEALAFGVVSSHGGRVVKYIGDEIMFVAVDPMACCRIAAELVRAFGDHSVEPRAGLAYGDVVTRYGDYYGAVVNVAARLAELAIPHEVLVAEELAEAVADRRAFEPAGRRLLKGFSEPVRVSSLALDECR